MSAERIDVPANGDPGGDVPVRGRGLSATRQPGPRRGRIWVILAILGFTIAIFAGIVELATQEPVEESLVELQGVGDSQRIFGGLRQLEDRVGDPDAPIQMQIFTDMQCELCAEQFMSTVPELVDEYVRPGELQLLYRHYSFSRNSVQEGFLGAEAAAAQSNLWQYVYIFFASQSEAERLGVDADYLRDIAASISSIEVPIWEDDFLAASEPDSEVMKRLAAQEDLARDLGLRAKPSVIINGPGGTETLQDSPSLEQIKSAIESVS